MKGSERKIFSFLNKTFCISNILFFFNLIWNFVNLRSYFLLENSFGTTYSPYSDALVPWLHGALVFYIDEFPMYLLYRPTVGIFYASLVSLLKNFYYIPYFIICYYYFQLSLTFLTASIRLKMIILGFLLILNLNDKILFSNISPQSITPDFFSFALVTISLFQLISSLEKKVLSLYLVGILHLGVASTIRGLPIAGLLGFILFGFYKFNLYSVNFKSKRFIRNFLLFTTGTLLSLGTLLLDSHLRNKYKVLNNAEISLYCIYAMPYNSYSSECQEEYTKLKMYEKSKEIVSNYFKFINSQYGYNLVKGVFTDYLQYDFDKFIYSKNVWIYSLFFLLFIIFEKLKITSRKIKWEFHWGSSFRFFQFHFLLVLNVLFVYIGGLIVFSLLVHPGEQRTLTTIKPSLILTLLLFLIPIKFQPSWKVKKLLYLQVAMSIFILVFLYSGNFIFPKEFVKELNERKSKEKIVFKLSDDPLKNYSLWRDETGFMFYTVRDSKPKLKFLNYKKINCPNGRWNESYKTPCQIEFQE